MRRPDFRILLKTVYFVFLLGCSLHAFPQVNAPKDSLAGFDAIAAQKYILSSGCTVAEAPVMLVRLQRDFVLQKFGFPKPSLLSQNQWRSVAINTACLNEDFEQSNAAIITSSQQVS